MNETTIIESKRSNAVAMIAKVGSALVIFALLLRAIFPAHWSLYNTNKVPFFYALIIRPFQMIGEGDNYRLIDWLPSAIFYIGIIILIVGLILVFAFKKVSLTITDKRVFGTAKWGKRVDLPLDMISAVATSALGGIAVSTSSGKIDFKGIQNNMDIHAEISKLLLLRQENNKENEKNNSSSKSDSEEILKLHDLLEKGIITKEEFETKKKQLLGL